MRTRTNLLVLSLAILAWCVMAAPRVLAQEYQPGDACTNTGYFARTSETTAANGGNFMICNGAAWAGFLHYSSSGFVGINNASPKTALDITGTVKLGDGGEPCSGTIAGALKYSGGFVYVCNGATWEPVNTGVGGLWTAGSGDSIYYNSGTPQVGIGTTTPAYTLDVNGYGAMQELYLRGFTGGAPVSSIPSVLNDLTDVNTAGAINDYVLTYNGGSWGPAAVGGGFWTAGTGDDIYYNSGTPKVGIGTTGPATALDVVGTLKIAYGSESCDATHEGAIKYDSTGKTFSFCADHTNDWEAVSLGSGTLAALSDTTISSPSGGELLYYSATAGKWVNQALSASDVTAHGVSSEIQFNSGNVLWSNSTFVYTSSGRLGVGTGSPAASLHIKSDTTTVPWIKFTTTTGGTDYASIDTDGSNYLRITAAAGKGLSLGANGTADKLVFTSAGRLGIGTTAPATELYVVGDVEYTGELTDVSDRRMKKDIENLAADQLEKILALQGVSFRMKEDPPTRQKELGFIAQDVEKLYPDLVKTTDNGIKSMNYVGLIAPMVEAMKEQESEISALRVTTERQKTQLEQQKAVNEDLKKQIDALRADLEALKSAQSHPPPQKQ